MSKVLLIEEAQLTSQGENKVRYGGTSNGSSSRKFGRVKDKIRTESLIRFRTTEGETSKINILELPVQSAAKIIVENAAKEPTSALGVENLVI